MQSQSGFQEKNVLLALGWYYPEIHRGVARFARDHHWHITFDFEDPFPVNWRGDGVLALIGANDRMWDSLKLFSGPIVDLAESRPAIPLPRVTMDNMGIGQLAAQYFLERGYRHFLFVHRWDLGVSHRRREAFEQTIQAAGKSCHVLCWQQEKAQRVDSREQRLSWLAEKLQSLPKPLAVFGTRDLDAAEVIEACLGVSLSVPEQVAVLGVDNAEMICDCLRVPMSSIDNNLELVGYEGAALLQRLMEGAKPPSATQYIPPVGIIERRSTDHLAVDHPQVVAALRMIHEQAHQPLSMRDILAKIPISRSGLEKAFRDHYVRPPMEELRHIRLQRAQKLLIESNDKIAAIAYRTGFETSHNLNRAFKLRFGLTPMQFRLQHRAPE